MLISPTKKMIKYNITSAFEEGAVGHKPGQTEANVLIGWKEKISKKVNMCQVVRSTIAKIKQEGMEQWWGGF